GPPMLTSGRRSKRERGVHMVRKRLRAVKSSIGSRSAVGLVLAAAAIAFALAAGGGSASGSPGVAIGFGSAGYKIHRSTELTGWEQPGFDDSSAVDWAAAQAPFGSNTAVCSFPAANTSFADLETIFLRKTFSVPDNAYGLHIGGTIDNG